VNNSRKIPHWRGITIFIFVCVALVWNCGDKGTNPSPPQIITPLPADAKVVSETSTPLTITARGSTLSYQWYYNETAITGAAATQYSKTWALADSGTYKVVVSNALGKDSSSTQLKVISLQDLFITSQVTGWVLDSSSHFVQYPAASLFNYIDGPAQRYIDSGLVSWFHETMNGGPTATPVGGDYAFDGYVHNYGTSAKAKALYGAKIAENITPFPSAKVTLGQYSDNEAQASAVGGGIQVYATFGALYFEFYFGGFTVSQISTIAVPEALKFLDTYKATIY
jgi:hypothetical protein